MAPDPSAIIQCKLERKQIFVLEPLDLERLRGGRELCLAHIQPRYSFQVTYGN